MAESAFAKWQYLSNTPDAVTEATADMAVILMLNILRGTTEAEMNVRAGRWREGLGLSKVGHEGSLLPLTPSQDPAGLKLGIIGLGSIGKSMSSKVPQFGMDVIYHNRTQLPAEGKLAHSIITDQKRGRKIRRDLCVFR